MRGDASAGSLFAWEATACPPGALCPSFATEQVYPSVLIAPGLYVERAYTFSRCPAGSFCLGGVRVACPPGYECPVDGLAAPVRCTWEDGDVDAARTCFSEATQSGVLAPEPCAAGRICVVPYAPGLPVPPGYFRSGGGGDASSRGGVVRCKPGEWCPLGRSGDRLFAPEELLCPAATYCSQESVAVPAVCNFSAAAPTFCPAGSVGMSACPSGHFCSRACGAPSNSVPPAAPPATACPPLSILPIRMHCLHRPGRGDSVRPAELLPRGLGGGVGVPCGPVLPQRVGRVALPRRVDVPRGVVASDAVLRVGGVPCRLFE